MLLLLLSLLDTPAEKAKFAALYALYKNRLYGVAFQLLHNEQDAEDCVQETLFYVARNFGKIGEVASRETGNYLTTVVSGFAVNQLRRAGRAEKVKRAEKDLGRETTAALEGYAAVEIADAIDAVLDEEEKNLFYLKYLYGYTSRELSDLYGVSDVAVRKKLQHARAALVKALKEGDARDTD